LFLPVAFMGLAYWTMQMPAVPARKLDQMRVGMTMDEVRGLLGNPSRDRGQIWQYTRMTWAILVVQFGPDARVVHFDHDF
jgi:hypothetical protein